MISSSPLATSSPSLNGAANSFASFGLSVFGDDQANQGGVGPGVSTAAVPLISAPLSRQSPDFKAAIAPPSQPTNPAIAPPTVGGYQNTLGGKGGMINGATAKLAYISDFRISVVNPQANSPFGGISEFQSILNRGFASRPFTSLG